MRLNSHAISRTGLLFLCVVLLACSHDNRYRLNTKLSNYKKIANFLRDYYATKGRYPASIVQLEHYVDTKQGQLKEQVTDPQDILGITNPFTRKSGYGYAYANAWDFKMVLEHNQPYTVGCDSREILYHPANQFQGFVLVDCDWQKIGSKNSFDYSTVFCYKKKCTYGIYFDYDIKTKTIDIDIRGLSFGGF